MNKYQTYSLIGKILALDEEDPLKVEKVKSGLQRYDIRWEKFVQMADYHLVLQAVYPKIREFHLEKYVPDELKEHLKYVFDLNTERNAKVVTQAADLTSLLTSVSITPLFMKGVGNILNKLYTYPGERILHDIDILVPEEKFEKAAEILLKDGYTSNFNYQPSRLKSLKHYPILYKPGEPFYVELHRMLAQERYSKYMPPGPVIMEAVHPVLNPSCLVMSDQNSIIHNFLHSQVDHRSRIFARAFMRDLYDMYLLSKRSDPEKVLAEFGHFRRNTAGYLDIIYETFDNAPSERQIPALFIHSYLFRYKLNLKSRLFGKLSFFFTRLIMGYVINPLRATWNFEMRKKLTTKLRNPAWYKKQVRYYMQILGLKGPKK